jgi:YesN/AraC family two-component response regulator
MITIVLADDHRMVRQGLRGLLEDETDLRVVGEAADGTEAVEVTARLKPDILVTDLKMPGLGGIQVIARVRELSPGTGVVILSMYGIQVYVDAALRAGARGYVVKKSASDGLK